MTRDLHVLRSGELMVALVEGETDAGVDFVDAFFHDKIVAVDAGRIVVPTDALDGLLTDAAVQGLTYEQEEGKP